jgi:hypothetical protein
MTMSAISDTAIDAGKDTGSPSDAGVGATANFRFLPSELAVKCRALIETFHEMLGYGCLPDMLWHSDARDIFECDRELAQLFRNASKSRCAKRTNDSLLLIATIVISLEALARDFAGWGKRFPDAKREAERLFGGFPLQRRIWLMDMYLYPSLSIHRELAGALAPSLAAGPVRS